MSRSPCTPASFPFPLPLSSEARRASYVKKRICRYPNGKFCHVIFCWIVPMLKPPAKGTLCSESGKNAIRGFSESVLCKVKLRSLFTSWALDPLPCITVPHCAGTSENPHKLQQKGTLSLAVKLVLLFAILI